MTNSTLLNNIDHKNLNVITERSAHYGDDVMFTMTFPVEFRSVQAHYPIFFQKHAETGQFYPVALFGFKEKENLFLSNGRWQASYLPMTIERQPFLIGFRNFEEDGVEKKQRVLHIDLDNPRLSENEGQPLFLEHGGNSPYLEHMANLMEKIHHAHQGTGPFIKAILEHELLESFTLDIELKDGSRNQLMGFYTINEDRLNALGGEALDSLNRDGHLQPIYMALASLSHIRSLIERKNVQLAER